jgi:integrase
MANRVAQIVSHMFLYGIHRAVVADSPVKLLYRPGGKEKPCERALDETELRAFLLNYKTVCRTSRSGHILMLLLLTMQRRQEAVLATKSEFDLIKCTWSIPDEHSKNGRGHVVPLSDWAAEEIEALMGLSGDSVYLLPRRGGLRPINPMLITRSVERLQERFKAIGVAPFSPHDLRRTGRTGLASLKVDEEIAERILNHQKKGMKRVYDRYSYFDEKRDALNKWSMHLKSLRDKALQEREPNAAAAFPQGKIRKPKSRGRAQ